MPSASSIWRCLRSARATSRRNNSSKTRRARAAWPSGRAVSGKWIPATAASRDTSPRRATISAGSGSAMGPRAGQGVGDVLLQAPGAHPRHRRVHGHDAPGAPVTGPPEHVHHRRAFICRRPRKRSTLPGEGHLGARGQLALPEGLVEEGGRQRPEDVGGHPGRLLRPPSGGPPPRCRRSVAGRSGCPAAGRARQEPLFLDDVVVGLGRDHDLDQAQCAARTPAALDLAVTAPPRRPR